MSEPAQAPSLTRRDAPGRARGVVLMLHGGQESSHALVDGRSASWRRCALLQRAITGRAHRAQVSTWLLRYRQRGWNGGAGPVSDARWALEEVRRLLGEVPVVLLGHSMGGRTAVHVAGDPTVRGVVALAPWFPPGDPVAALTGKHLVAAHGRRDPVTAFTATEAYVDRARRVTASAELHDMGPVGHYLLRRVPAWNEIAVTGALGILGR